MPHGRHPGELDFYLEHDTRMDLAQQETTVCVTRADQQPPQTDITANYPCNPAY
ncbi:hypothetical protein [Streptomyces sp. NPDC052042]|uniref:hypothetical protein n=1 Tax=Streptomyces sp. NPDC052042 TaxID=3365683 RepID=UPI0037D039EF